MHNISQQLNAPQYQKIWQEYMPKQFAWGTIALAGAVISGYCIVIPLALNSFIPYWLASIFCGYLAFASFTVGHEAGHGAIIRSGSNWKRCESVLGWLSTIPLLATSYRLFQKIHDRHHSFTNDPDRDPDYIPSDKGLFQLIIGLGIIPFRYNWLALTRFNQNKSMRDTYMPTLLFFLIVWGTLLALSLHGYATEVIFFCLLPLVIANTLLLTFFDYIPHYPHKSQDVHQATRMYPSRLLNLLLFGQNYHLIHHMYPKLPWYQYKSVYERIEPYLKQRNAAIDYIDKGEKLFSSENGNVLPAGADFMHWNIRVKQTRTLNKDAIEIEFELPQGWLDYQPGQYLTVSKWLSGKHYTRCYSLCASPAHRQLKIAVKRIPNGVMSSYLNDQVKPGDQLSVKGPFGDFIYPCKENVPSNHQLVLIAAGSGITPILAIAEYALQNKPDVQVDLIYANKNVASIMFLEQLQNLQAQFPYRLTITWVLEQGSDLLHAYQGRVDQDILKFVLNTSSTPSYVYICGPEPMKNTVLKQLDDIGVQNHQVFVEEFVAKTIQPIGALHNVDISLSDGQQHCLQVAGNQTVLDVAQQQGIDLPHACGTGLCGSCKFRVNQGTSKAFSAPGISDMEIAMGYTLACQCKPMQNMTLVEFD
jgi:ferredoxin-NADP reductase/fatty acid desaturase